MLDKDFSVIEPSYKPFWRDAKQRPTTGLKRYVLGFLTAICVGLIMVPPEFGYYEPISVQIFAGDRWAWALFYSIGAVLAYTSVRLWKAERPFSATFCGLAAFCLAGVASTYPFSATHFMFFLSVLAMSLGWLWSVQKELEDEKLRICAITATVGTVTCLFSMGIGERVVMLSMLAGINVLFYEFVLY